VKLASGMITGSAEYRELHYAGRGNKTSGDRMRNFAWAALETLRDLMIAAAILFVIVLILTAIAYA
jgi:hypothetical protein